MCGRFALNETPAKLAVYFQSFGNIEFAPAFNIAPSRRIITVTSDMEERRHLRQMRWGLIPSWAKDPAIGNKLINARGETVAEKPSFRSAFKSHRCLIPASGFYEWKSEAGNRNPWYISLKSGEPMAFAGLWETWHARDGETIESCCIITTNANALMLPIHDRMPAILHADRWETWLSPNERQAGNLLPLIQPHEAESMRAWPVTRDLNKVGNRDDASLIQPQN